MSNLKWKKHLFRADGALYLVRYTLLWLPFLKIRLHHILLSDTECPHDHPWDFVSIILKGGYREQLERGDPGGVGNYISEWYPA